jgi:hypothetical protein
MSTLSRRTTLAMLGLAPATAVGAETFLPPVEGGGVQVGFSTDKIMANAFRQLAENIEAGRVCVRSIDLGCSVRSDVVIEHTLTTTFSYEPEKS